MRLTLHTDLALRLLMLLDANRDTWTNLTFASEKLEASQNHLNKVAQRLAKEGWVVSQRGRGGGLRLGMDAQEVSIGTVVRTLEAPSALVACMPGGNGQCTLLGPCRLKAILQNAEEAFLNELDKVAIGKLTEKNQQLANLLLDPA